MTILTELDPEMIDKLAKEDLWYRILVLLGAQYRDLHCTGVVCSSIYFNLCVFFYFGPLFYDKYKDQKFCFDAYSSTTYDYVRQPEKYYTKMRDWSGAFKKRLIVSSEFFYTKIKQQEDNSTGPRDTLDFQQTRPCQKLKHLVDARQFEPKNRNEDWVRKLNRTWLLLQFSLVLYDFMCAAGVCLFAKEIFFRVRKETKLSVLDRLSMFEETMFHFFGTYLFSNPLVKVILNEFDMNRLLADLNCRMSRLVVRLKHYREMYCMIEDEKVERFLEDARRICNKEGLEVYMFFRYFAKEQANHKQLANLIVSQYLCYLACIIFTLLSVVKSIKKDDFVMVAVVIMVCSFTNCVFVLCASTNSKCIRVMQIAWQLLANSQQTEIDRRIDKQSRLKSISPLETIENQNTYLISRQRVILATSCLSDAQDNLVVNFIDPYTRFLWYRLVQDQTQVAGIFTYKALGFYQLNYSSMIQYNFWLTSLMMATYMRDWL